MLPPLSPSPPVHGLPSHAQYTLDGENFKRSIEFGMCQDVKAWHSIEFGMVAL